MIRGFYTAASGIITQEKKLNAISNNLANVSTAGYKKDALISGTFGEHLAVKMNTYNQSPLSEIGRGVYMQTIDSKYTDYAQGDFQATDRPLDMAIQGEGFFVLKDQDGNDLLTRNGQFAIDAEGYLVLPGYGRVQGEGGDIEVGTSSFTVDKFGYISALPQVAGEEITEVDRLLVVAPDNYDTLAKNENGMFVADNFTPIDDINRSAILQMSFEKSNVNMAEEMTRMMASQRGLQSASQLVKMYDELSDKTITQIPRV